MKNIWADIIRAYITLPLSPPSPAFTTFFKSADSVSKVSDLLASIIDNSPPGKDPLSFHCVSENSTMYPRQYQRCLAEPDRPVGFLSGNPRINDITICPQFFDKPFSPVIGQKKTCPGVQRNRFVVPRNQTIAPFLGNLRGTGLTELTLQVYLRHVRGPSLNIPGLEAGLNATTTNVRRMNAAVRASVDKSVVELSNYLFYVLSKSRIGYCSIAL